jgi:hypothetical protein
VIGEIVVEYSTEKRRADEAHSNKASEALFDKGIFPSAETLAGRAFQPTSPQCCKNIFQKTFGGMRKSFSSLLRNKILQRVP